MKFEFGYFFLFSLFISIKFVFKRTIFPEYFEIEKRRKINKQLGNAAPSRIVFRRRRKEDTIERERERKRKRSVKFPGYLKANKANLVVEFRK